MSLQTRAFVAGNRNQPPWTDTFCSSCPSKGWATRSGDCDDSDTEAHPGANGYFSTPRRGAGGYDFNCDGRDTPEKTSYPSGCAGTDPTCSDVDQRNCRPAMAPGVCGTVMNKTCTAESCLALGVCSVNSVGGEAVKCH